jgi:opacity protein-like surface antigen
MNRNSIIALALGVSLAAGGTPVVAQTAASKPGSIGVMGGATFPRSSDFSDMAKTGWNAGVLLRLGAAPFPLSFRLEGQWNQLKGKTIDVPDRGSNTTDYRIIDGTADFEWTFGRPAVSNFYLIGGVGFYKLRGTDHVTPGNIPDGVATTVTENATKFGWNGGAGFRFQLSGYSMFIEGRYHDVSHGHEVDGSGSSKPLHFIPVDIGITF